MCGLPCAGSLGVLTRNVIGGMNTKALMRIQVREREMCMCTHMHTNTSNLQFPIDLPIAVQYNEKDPFTNGNWENRLLAQTNLHASGTGHFAQSNGIGILWLLFASQISLQWTWWQWLQSPHTKPGNRKMQSAVPGFVLTCPHSVFPFVAMMIWMKRILASSVPCDKFLICHMRRHSSARYFCTNINHLSMVSTSYYMHLHLNIHFNPSVTQAHLFHFSVIDHLQFSRSNIDVWKQPVTCHISSVHSESLLLQCIVPSPYHHQFCNHWQGHPHIITSFAGHHVNSTQAPTQVKTSETWSRHTCRHPTYTNRSALMHSHIGEKKRVHFLTICS